MTSTVVETQGLTKRFRKGVLAVDRLDLSVGRGEVYGFLGPNGAGKTTTLRMLLGLIHPTAGSASVLGSPPGSSEGLGGVGAVIETPAFYPYLSGRDNLRVFARYGGVAEGQLDDALQEVGLTSRSGDKVKGYSMGMRQRLGIAAALLKQPTLLILDEPTNGLDPQGMAEMRTFIRQLGRGERTVLLSSHLLGEVEQVCDRVGVIQRGRLVGQGSVAELRGQAGLFIRADPVEQAQALVTEVLGSEAVQALDGSLRLSAPLDTAGDLNRRLVEAGVTVTELRPVERTLEQVFFQLTAESEEQS